MAMAGGVPGAMAAPMGAAVAGGVKGAGLGADAVPSPDWPQLLKRFGQARWKRNAWVQMRSARNGTIFHADGALRSARNLSMGLLRERLLDNPRLYSGPPEP